MRRLPVPGRPTDMYPAGVRYLRAGSTEEVLAVLDELGPDARVLAGGASLIPQLKYRQVQPPPAVVVDLNWLDDLRGIVSSCTQILVGPMSRHEEAARHATLAANVAAAQDVGLSIGDQQIRNMGTIGGGLVAVEPTGDWAPCLIACGGSVVVGAASGERRIPAAELFAGPLRSTLRPEELLMKVVFPVMGDRSSSAHAKFLIRAVTSLGGCTVSITLDGDAKVRRVGVGLGGVTPLPVAVPEVSSVLEGEQVTSASVAEAQSVLARAIETYSDSRASAGHRRSVAQSLFTQALGSAYARAVGSPTADHRRAT